MRPITASRAACTIGWFLVLMGVGLAVAGGWLLFLGGSWYYMAGGLTWVLTGILLLRGHPVVLGIFGAYFLATLVWALWEAGLDWWPLAARLDIPFLLGMLLLTPWIRRGLHRRDKAHRHAAGTAHPEAQTGVPLQYGGGVLLMGALTLFAGVSIASWLHDPHRIDGALPSPSAAQVTAPAPAPVTRAPTPSSAPEALSSPATPLPQQNAADAVPHGEWHAYGRTAYGQRYSPLTDIQPGNVGRLQVAWQYRTGDMEHRQGDPQETTFQVTPLKVGNHLFLCTPHQSVIALDATTGAELWRHEPQVQGGLALQHLTCRGVSYRPAGSSASSAGQATCAAKLYMPTADGRVLALDPATGTPCPGFGDGTGQLNLWAHMPNVKPGSYYSTSPVVVTRKLIIVGGTVLDNVSTQEASGVIRAFDADTGALVWNWDSGNPDDTTPLAPGQRYTPNSPNSWSISSVDESLGMVYVPLGNQPPDQWGGNRSESTERHSSSVVALDLETGHVRWVFQTVHHDLWDYDVPAQPSLIDLRLKGEQIPALVQPTKQGELFVLDRRTGKPVLPVHEVPAPQGAAEGDYTALMQPQSALSFDPPRLTEADMWGATLFDQLACRIAFRKLRYEGRYTPPSEQGSLIYPGNFGVFNWGGISVDPERQIAFATPTYLAFTSRLVRRSDSTSYLVQDKKGLEGRLPALNENFGAPFAVRLGPFTSPLRLPCQKPPWGYVAAADLTTGKVIWMHRNGTVRDSSPLPLPFRMGVPNLGGPITTAGGVAFLSGTLDYYVRAYDLHNGEEIWRSRLPAGGQATPMTYRGEDGRQYLLVVAGGHGSLGTKRGITSWPTPCPSHELVGQRTLPDGSQAAVAAIAPAAWACDASVAGEESNGLFPCTPASAPGRDAICTVRVGNANSTPNAASSRINPRLMACCMSM